jgi:hypothetical protein
MTDSIKDSRRQWQVGGGKRQGAMTPPNVDDADDADDADDDSRRNT